MVTACLIASTMKFGEQQNDKVAEDDLATEIYDPMDGPSEEEVYLAGMFRL
jgi:hypothetical protein